MSSSSRARVRASSALTRIARVAATMLGVLLTTFVLVHSVPGDPALSILGTRATPETHAALRAELRLDEPMLQQLLTFLRNAVTGDLGMSLVQSGRSVNSIVLEGFRVTLALTGLTIVVSLAAGIPAGLMAAVSPSPRIDALSRTLVTCLLAVPPFLVGFVLLLAVSSHPEVAPVGDWTGGLMDALQHLWLPAVALSCFLLPIVFRTVRQAARDVAREEYVEAAVVRGTAPVMVVAKHILPNSVLPLLAVLSVNIGGLIGGAIVIETVFNLPGVGRTLVQAVETRDYPVVQGVAIASALLVVLVSQTADLAARALDPRVRRGDR